MIDKNKYSFHIKSFFENPFPYLNRFFPAFFAVGMLFILIPIITCAYFAADLTSKERIMNRNDQGITLYDRNDEPFFTFYEAKNKTFIPLDQIPKHTQNAVIAIEDKEFYNHPGFSFRGIVRSIVANLRSQEVVSGGSTITQQLVKIALLSPKKSFLRKYQELVLAEEIERRYNKEEILEMYLNTVYFGENAFGVEEAAQEYFGISAKDIDVAQSAMLAGLLPAPSEYSPKSGNIQEAQARQSLVLQKMFEQGYITFQEKETAEKTKLTYTENPERVNVVAPHFAIMVKNQLIEKYGEEQIARSGMKIKTSLDLEWQKIAEQIVKEQVHNLAINRVSNGAAVVLNPKTGEILVMVGSRDWYDNTNGKINIVTTPRQPGSSFKPIIYSKALESQTITPGTLLSDAPTTFEGGYRPVNYDRRFRGKVLPRKALANSLNVPAVEVMSKIGVVEAIDWAHEMGISTLGEPVNYGLSLVLGAGEVPPLELTSAYAVFANEGKYNPPLAILEIVDKKGKTIYKPQIKPQEVLDPRVAFIISSFLSDNQARAEVFGNVLNISRTAAVKTGTTDDYKDSWTLGYTPSLAIGVWVGNNDNTPMDNIAGSLGAAPIWKRLMEEFLAGTPVESFSPPAGLVEAFICYKNTITATSKDGDKEKKETKTTSIQQKEYFLAGTEPTGPCSNPIPVGPTTTNIPEPTNNQLTSTPAPSATNQSTPTNTLIPTVTPTFVPTATPNLK